MENYQRLKEVKIAELYSINEEDSEIKNLLTSVGVFHLKKNSDNAIYKKYKKSEHKYYGYWSETNVSFSIFIGSKVYQIFK